MIHMEEDQGELQINLTPMIDMAFLLIIFFLTATVFPEIEREQDVLLPTNSNPSSLSRSHEDHLVINILKDGTVKFYGMEVSQEELVPGVRQRRERSRKVLKVMVRADYRTLFDNVARVLAAVERAGVQKPYIVTRRVVIEE